MMYFPPVYIVCILIHPFFSSPTACSKIREVSFVNIWWWAERPNTGQGAKQRDCGLLTLEGIYVIPLIQCSRIIAEEEVEM